MKNKVNKTKLALVTLFLSVFAAPAAMAQGATNAGVAEIVTAIEGLAPDMGFVVTASVVVALVGIGAVLAISLGKRIFGK